MSRDKRRYARVNTDLPSHPKIQSHDDPNGIFTLFVCGLLYCMEHLTDGLIPTRAVKRLMPESPDNLGGLVESLTDLGMWVDEGHGYRVRDYLEHQMSKSSIEAMREGGRKGGLKGGFEGGFDEGLKPMSKPIERVPRSKSKGKGKSNEEGLSCDVLEGSGITDASPPCLCESDGTNIYRDGRGTEFDAPIKAAWSDIEYARGGIIPDLDRRKFAAMMSHCPDGCTGTKAQKVVCLDAIDKAATKTRGKPTPLFDKVMREDRG